MAKHIIYPQVTFTQFVEEPILKRLALFFEHIYVGEGGINHLMTIPPSSTSSESVGIAYEQTTWQFLQEKGIVKTYPYMVSAMKNAEESNEGKALLEQFGKLMPIPGAAKLDPAEALRRFFLSHDIMVRLDAIELQKQQPDEFYPGVRSTGSYPVQLEKKSNIIQFLLEDIPQPDTSTSWEQIVDFRSDEVVKNKYLALIHWINKMSNSPGSINEIKEEYEYLYHDYIKHFKLHQLKYNNTVLEVIVTAGAGLLLALQSGAFISSFKHLLQMNLSHIRLLEEESKMPGKEVAYIYHAKNTFGK